MGQPICLQSASPVRASVRSHVPLAAFFPMPVLMVAVINTDVPGHGLVVGVLGFQLLLVLLVLRAGIVADRVSVWAVLA